MQALSDEQQMERLERKVDEGFAEMRAEFKAVRGEIRTEFKAVRAEMRAESTVVRAELGSQVAAARSDARSDFRLLLGILLPMYLTIILGFATILLQDHL